jgi:hypothetical protein
MDIGETLHVTSREEWRQWLADNHRGKKEIQLVIHKKSSGERTTCYEEALEVAMCCGWIDSQTKSIDGSKYAQRFPSRRPTLNWSDPNTALALKMLCEGKTASADIASRPPELLGTWRSEGEEGHYRKNPPNRWALCRPDAKASAPYMPAGRALAKPSGSGHPTAPPGPSPRSSWQSP